MNSDTTPIANPTDHNWNDGLYLIGFMHGIEVFVWADSFDSAFEEAVEYCDDNGHHGVFTFLGASDYAHAAAHLGLKWDPSAPDSRVRDRAEADLTMIGWTTLNCERERKESAFVAGHEWTGSDVQDYETFATIKWRSIEADNDEG